MESMLEREVKKGLFPTEIPLIQPLMKFLEYSVKIIFILTYVAVA